MKIPQKLRKIARRARAVLFPIGKVPDHLCSLVRKTSNELGFEKTMVQKIELEAKITTEEMGI
jgi:hypothetical protein